MHAHSQIKKQASKQTYTQTSARTHVYQQPRTLPSKHPRKQPSKQAKDKQAQDKQATARAQASGREQGGSPGEKRPQRPLPPRCFCGAGMRKEKRCIRPSSAATAAATTNDDNDTSLACNDETSRPQSHNRNPTGQDGEPPRPHARPRRPRSGRRRARSRRSQPLRPPPPVRARVRRFRGCVRMYACSQSAAPPLLSGPVSWGRWDGWGGVGWVLGWGRRLGCGVGWAGWGW